MTRPGEALRLALRDFYANSWRLVPANAALGLLLVLVVAAVLATRAALVLLVLAGPVAAAVVHCAVTLVRTGEVRTVTAVEGLRLHWRRGLALGAAGTALVGLGVLAVGFYARSLHAWPLAFVTLYLVAACGVYQVVLWTIAIAEPEQPLAAAAREAAELIARRPGATVALGAALLLVNAIGVAAALMPFLTLTVAYSFLAAAHFALPHPISEGSS